MRPLTLLFGLPRSGTSWIGKIFDSHPSTVYRHEPDARGALKEIALLPDASELDRFVPAARRFVHALPRARGVKVGASVPVFPKDYLSTIRLWAKRSTVWSARVAARALGEMHVPEWVDYERIPQAPIVWKSVESTGRLGLFATRFPHARAILLLRHPCAHVASNVRALKLGKFAGRYDPFDDAGLFDLLTATEQGRRYGLTAARLAAMSPAERLAWKWVVFNEKAVRDTQGLANCRVVRYEDVCDDPAGVAADLFAFAGLGWNEQSARFVAESTSTHDGAYYSIFKDPVRAANRWRAELPPDTVERVLATIGSTAMSRYYER